MWLLRDMVHTLSGKVCMWQLDTKVFIVGDGLTPVDCHAGDRIVWDCTLSA